MTSRIRLLDELTINQIAAGEVIENPSSVVKELVENALDAEASDISIEINAGGRQLIRITDNGIGMSYEDALLSLERHATSKLHKVDDLASIGTMGFRGEAVPSIASISKFQMRTKPWGSEAGTLLQVEGGRIVNSTHCATEAGTCIEVKDLFFNVPVRRKFQKSPASDQNEILKIATSIALAFPSLRLRLVADQKILLNAPENMQDNFLHQLEQRVKDVLGHDFFEELQPLSFQNEDYLVEGFIGHYSNHRPNRSSQFLFINKRNVQSLLASYAIRDGYGPALPTGRFPVFILHLTMPKSDLDVNVHPQKREVRFHSEEKLRNFLKSAVEAALQKETQAPFSIFEPALTLPSPPIFKEQISFASYSLPEREHRISLPKNEPEQELFYLPKKELNVPKAVFCFKHFLVLESAPEGLNREEGLCIVDLEAAFFRTFYEKTLSSLQKERLPSQSLLVPITFELIPEEAEILNQNLDLFEKLGFEIREFAPKTFVVEAVPNLFSQASAEETILEIISSLKEEGRAHHWKKIEASKMAFAVAKKAKFIKNPSLFEAELLLKELLSCQQPYFSPAGQATIISLSCEMLSLLFKK